MTKEQKKLQKEFLTFARKDGFVFPTVYIRPFVRG